MTGGTLYFGKKSERWAIKLYCKAEQIKLPTDKANELPNKLKSTYTLWSEGHDLRSMMSRRTYYYHRKMLIEYGIDIDIQPNQHSTTNVVPMFRIIEAVPTHIPQ
jgi:II/X family phage/plasmid replication protein